MNTSVAAKASKATTLADADRTTAVGILERLVAFDTVSANSNLDLIDWIADYLSLHGVEAHYVRDADGRKANLYATIGPMVAGGVVLSGHTDVVPVSGQDWTSPPFMLDIRQGRLYGRGTCDMKGFIACVLAAVPHFKAANLQRPIHLAFSYDEEVGCLGAPDMIRQLADVVPGPLSVIVGEPTMMKPVGQHKGLSIYRVSVRGKSAHSSLTHLGISANAIALRLMQRLSDIADNLESRPDRNFPIEPAHSTLTIGLMNGGTGTNILAGAAEFWFDLRCLPGQNPNEILAPFFAEVEAVKAELAREWPEAGIEVEQSAAVPPFEMRGADDPAQTLLRRLTGDNGTALTVSYGSEAGQFQQAGNSVVICGPGSIEQAHKPDEFVALDQIAACMAMMDRLAVEMERADA